MTRVFLLSPANLTGARGRALLDGRGRSAFSGRLDEGAGVPLGEVYAFVSSLYYRGKRAYARAFGSRAGGPAALVITPSRGLLPDDHPIDLEALKGFAAVDIDPADARYHGALTSSAAALDRALGPGSEVVLLGSIASAKYLEPLAQVFGDRLLFPRAFIGRGDMSRGGLLLRAAAAGTELEYVAALRAERRGRRPPRLTPAKRKRR